MATAKSIISVAILGDAKNLLRTFDTVDTRTGGFLKSAAKVAVAGTVVKKGFDVLGDALGNADDFRDSMDDLAGTMSPEFARRIQDMSGDFTNIGLSAPEVGAMAASWANLAKAAGVSAPLIETMTPDLLKLAASIAATTGKTVDEVIADIGNAAGPRGQAVMRDYGVVVDKALSPEAKILDVFQQLLEKTPELTEKTGGLADKQDILGAKWDTFTTNVGLAVEGPLTDVVGWFADVSEMIPSAMDGFGMLGDRIIGFARDVLGPLGNVRDVLQKIAEMLPGAAAVAGSIRNPANLSGDPFRRRESNTVQDVRNYNTRNGVVINRIGGQ